MAPNLSLAKVRVLMAADAPTIVSGALEVPPPPDSNVSEAVDAPAAIYWTP